MGRLTFPLRIGSHFVAADHGARGREEVLKPTRDWLLRWPPPGPWPSSAVHGGDHAP
ncbi:hypothetical protein [Streptomyces sp. YGL11-2]|uniref:hypothetical protein n=1 Tax=Streptomyces sp. YGL11-2 TaxID=3414028 RepID=UPI003CED1794